MIKMKNLVQQQENLKTLIQFAYDAGYHANIHPDDFVELFTSYFNGPLTRRELTNLTILVQRHVRLPVYTTTMASAWLGVGIDTIRDAVWRHDPPKMRTMKPGHDVLVTHGELVRFLDNGN